MTHYLDLRIKNGASGGNRIHDKQFTNSSIIIKMVILGINQHLGILGEILFFCVKYFTVIINVITLVSDLLVIIIPHYTYGVS